MAPQTILPLFFILYHLLIIAVDAKVPALRHGAVLDITRHGAKPNGDATQVS